MNFKNNFMYKRYIKVVVLIILVILLISLKDFNISFPQKVNDVIDGDTVQLADGTMVRYIGIDTPETQRKSEDGEWIYDPCPFSRQAKEYNEQLVKNRTVKIKTDIRREDKFGRVLAYVYPVENNLSFLQEAKVFFGFSDTVLKEMANTQILKQGLAIIDVRSPGMSNLKAFIEAQEYARENKNGLWKTNFSPIMPEAAKFRIGEIITLQGEVTDIKKRGIVLILTLDKTFPLVIFESNLKFFSEISIDSLLHKEIEAYGMVDEYKGEPQIIICHPLQIKLVE